MGLWLRKIKKCERAQVGTIVLLLVLLAISSLVIMNWKKTNSLEQSEAGTASNALELKDRIKSDIEKAQKESLDRIEEEQKNATK